MNIKQSPLLSLPMVEESPHSSSPAPNCSKNDDHCCYLRGHVCPILEQNIEGRRWSCRLRRELGSWDLVHTSPEYKLHVQPFWDTFKDGKGSCGSYPRPGIETCGTCGGAS